MGAPQWGHCADGAPIPFPESTKSAQLLLPCQIEMTRARRDSLRVVRKGGPADLSTKLFSFMSNVCMLALWKTLWAVSLPIGKLIALNLWLGRSFLTLAIHFEHQVLRAIGWLSSPALPPHSKLARVYKRQMGSDVKNWHVGLGKLSLLRETGGRCQVSTELRLRLEAPGGRRLNHNFYLLPAATVVAIGVVTSAVRKWQERMDARHRRRACLRRLLSAANSYEQWREIAEQLYALEEADMPAGDVSTRRAARLYDRKLLLEKTNHLRSVRATGNVKEIMLALRTDLIRNIANIAKRQVGMACVGSRPRPWAHAACSLGLHNVAAAPALALIGMRAARPPCPREMRKPPAGTVRLLTWPPALSVQRCRPNKRQLKLPPHS